MIALLILLAVGAYLLTGALIVRLLFRFFGEPDDKLDDDDRALVTLVIVAWPVMGALTGGYGVFSLLSRIAIPRRLR